LRRSVNYRVREVRFSVVRESVSDPRELSTPAAVVALVSKLGDAMIPDDAREHFIVLLLNTKNRLVAFHRVSIGTLSGTLVQPREVFGPALRTMGVASRRSSSFTIIRAVIRRRAAKTFGSHVNSSKPGIFSISSSTITSSSGTALMHSSRSQKRGFSDDHSYLCPQVDRRFR
jgi:hypothetical protein